MSKIAVSISDDLYGSCKNMQRGICARHERAQTIVDHKLVPTRALMGRLAGFVKSMVCKGCLGYKCGDMKHRAIADVLTDYEAWTKEQGGDDYKRARGAAPEMGGLSPEEAIRRGRG